ncbi:sensor histidine kinase [Defluviitalea phaphyphila]|uniref:sensor histidine kinase n=1 Tax=Defluviitalea phaphyphila TaxID=1473580 RepID=UPI000730A922|nr:sensor histidine kinase [Defluviitalea phaphyphila]
MHELNMEQLDEIVKRTIDSIEQSKNEIYDIAEHAKNEYDKLKQELIDLKKNIRETIDKVEKYERDLKKSKQKLMMINKNFDKYSQKDMELIYNKTDEIRINLAVEREREQMLIQRRNDLESRLKSSQQIIKKAENLINHVAVALNFLAGDLRNISNQIEDLQEKKSLGIKILKAQETERQRVAREIHDGPAQSMSNVVLKAELCLKLLDKDINKTRNELINLKEMVRTSIQDVRRIIYDLRPMSLDDLGIVPTLERYISKITEQHNIVIKFNVVGSPYFLTSIISLTLFRIAQEAINNILKHSRATEASVKLLFSKKYVELFINDNGQGFNIEEVQERIKDDGSGFGLSSMKERAQLLEGQFIIKSKPNQGTRCYIRIPLKEKGV